MKPVEEGDRYRRHRWLFLARLLSAGVGVAVPVFLVYIGVWDLLTEPAPEVRQGVTDEISLQMGLLSYVIGPALIAAFALACWRPRAGVVAVWVGVLAHSAALAYGAFHDSPDRESQAM